MSSSPLPPCGTYARAVGRPSGNVPGCHCDACNVARRRYNARRYYAQASGRSYTVPAGPVQERLLVLFDSGASWARLQEVTGCSHATLSRLRNGHYRRVHRKTAERIAAVRIVDVVAPQQSVPALGTIRRARALVAAGHTLKLIAATAPCDPSLMRQIVTGNMVTLSRRTADRVAAAYTALSAVPGTSVRSLRRAEREGWPHPSQLLDDDLDAPPATGTQGVDPVVALRLVQDKPAAVDGFRFDLARILVEEHRLTVGAAAEKVGVSERTVLRWKKKWRAAA
ncbi:hypothetical protein GCM10010193_69460 [Kitasatospora atroaurantiaca]|uniref:Helix-turn-helix protein n=1 Tax=Kitasatospora atroaurantiaca TaxID=285545 RepID=A0A561EN39_9ACTN|nr:helix-turn-helix transcriptional regulator [Kitasatospora atroaurantiaca]TWE17033.1 helix-turn-helix protein [Kitasatospora atroaurantiaca]